MPKMFLSAAKIVETIPDALSGCTYAIATTARQRGFNAPLDLPEIALPTLISPSPDGDPISNTALLFGPEDRGLSNTELSYAQRFIKIPSSPIYSALNLAQAVAICLFTNSTALPHSPPEAQQNANIPFDSSPTLPKRLSRCLPPLALIPIIW